MLRVLRPVISVVLVTGSVLGIINVNEDPGRIEPLAIEAACNDCEPILHSGTANPFQIKFRYTVNRSERVEVVCRKRFVFLGDYNCAKVVD